jgi:hypothetical protein
MVRSCGYILASIFMPQTHALAPANGQHRHHNVSYITTLVCMKNSVNDSIIMNAKKWYKNWQGKLKYPQKTRPTTTSSTTDPT